MPSPGLLTWLSDSDPTLRWQVERDLARAPRDVWTATRASIATTGFGSRLLELQDPEGTWAGGAFFPADFTSEEMADVGQPWTATTWTLNTLREWGMASTVLREQGTAELLARNCRWEYGDLPYWGGEVDCCINAYTLANGLWLGVDLDTIDTLVEWFHEHQLVDGGWNCEWVDGSTRSSFHSTLNTLRGLLAYDVATGGSADTCTIRHAGEEYLLRRGLFRRLSTDQRVAEWVSHFSYPFRWRYNVLAAAAYFREASAFDRTPPDPRMADAVELIRAARRPDGTWLQGPSIPGRTWFDIDVPTGEPSKWLSLYAIRVLEWWDSESTR